MTDVLFSYTKDGRKVKMAMRYADILQKLGHGTFEGGILKGNTPPEEPRVSEAVLQFAEENGVDITAVVGTGKDGRVKKSDVEAAIKPSDEQDLA